MGISGKRGKRTPASFLSSHSPRMLTNFQEKILVRLSGGVFVGLPDENQGVVVPQDVGFADAELQEFAFGGRPLRQPLGRTGGRGKGGCLRLLRAEAETMLRNYGIEDHKIAAALELVVAQRLVRRLCVDCRAPAVPDDGERACARTEKRVRPPEPVPLFRSGQKRAGKCRPWK